MISCQISIIIFFLTMPGLFSDILANLFSFYIDTNSYYKTVIVQETVLLPYFEVKLYDQSRQIIYYLASLLIDVGFAFPWFCS